ncbi:ankyrin, partial [Hyaloscypha hepaticicola]
MAPHKKHVNSSGQTLLAIACSRGKLDIVKQRYEERPEDVNLADNALNTPLHIASLEGFVDIVQFLIDTGTCELDALNDVKDTPLHDAVDNKNVEVVKLLLDAGANPNLANTEGNEPLD